MISLSSVVVGQGREASYRDRSWKGIIMLIDLSTLVRSFVDSCHDITSLLVTCRSDGPLVLILVHVLDGPLSGLESSRIGGSPRESRLSGMGVLRRGLPVCA